MCGNGQEEGMDRGENTYQAIHSWPEEDRPRERLMRYGEQTLSDSELLAILLRTGARGTSALDLARRILDRFGTFRRMSQADPVQWRDFKGMGPGKIAQVKAAIEIGRRFQEQELRVASTPITSSAEMVKVLMPRMRDLTREVFKVVLLNARNRVIGLFDETEGTVNQAAPMIREIFQKALQHCAVSLICAHNHPSGDVTPSEEDKRFTRRLREAGEIMQVRVLDHIIIGNNQYYSFSDEGLL